MLQICFALLSRLRPEFQFFFGGEFLYFFMTVSVVLWYAVSWFFPVENSLCIVFYTLWLFDPSDVTIVFGWLSFFLWFPNWGLNSRTSSEGLLTSASMDISSAHKIDQMSSVSSLNKKLKMNVGSFVSVNEYPLFG